MDRFFRHSHTFSQISAQAVAFWEGPDLRNVLVEKQVLGAEYNGRLFAETVRLTGECFVKCLAQANAGLRLVVRRLFCSQQLKLEAGLKVMDMVDPDTAATCSPRGSATLSRTDTAQGQGHLVSYPEVIPTSSISSRSLA